MGSHNTRQWIKIYLKYYKKDAFYSLWYMKVFCNTNQLMEAETKLIHIIYLKSFFNLDNILLLKYMYILFSHKLFHMM